MRIGQSIRPVGSDISYCVHSLCMLTCRKGQLIASAGDRITPTEIGLLSSLGILKVSVYPRPVVAVLSTGNELVEAHENPLPGYDYLPCLANFEANSRQQPTYDSVFSPERICHTGDRSRNWGGQYGNSLRKD